MAQKTKNSWSLNESWRKEFFEFWGKLPPFDCDKWQAEWCGMIGEEAQLSYQEASSNPELREDILKEFEDFVAETSGQDFEDYVESEFQSPNGSKIHDLITSHFPDDDDNDDDDDDSGFSNCSFEVEVIESGASTRHFTTKDAEVIKLPASINSAKKKPDILKAKNYGREGWWDENGQYHTFVDDQKAKFGDPDYIASASDYSYSDYYGSYSSWSSDKEKMRKMPYRPPVIPLPEKTYRQTIMVGDLHGCADELLILLDDMGFDPGQDRLILCGDIVDRGPKIHECFEIARDYNAFSVLGNHEEPFLKWWMFETDERYKDKWSGKNNPIDLTSRSDQKATLDALTKEDWYYMDKMQLFYKLDEFPYNPIVVHAGLFPGNHEDPEDMDPFSIIRMINLDWRNETVPFYGSSGKPWWDKYDDNPGKHHVIYGHSTNPEVRLNKHSTGLDTGCVYGGALSGISLPGWEYYSVPCLRDGYYVSSAAEISGGQSFVIGTTKESSSKKSKLNGNKHNKGKVATK